MTALCLRTMDAAITLLHNLIEVPVADLIFLHAHETPRCRATVGKRFDYHTLQLMTRGAIRLSYADEPEVELRGRWAWPAGPAWSAVAFGPSRTGGWWHHRYAAFAGRLADDWVAAGLMPRGPQSLDAGACRQVAARLSDAIAFVARPPNRLARLRATNALEGALLALADARAGPVAASDAPAWLNPILLRLADAEAADVDLAAEAETAGASVTTLRRAVLRATGLPPHAYRLQHKVLAARRLLAETDAPIKAIARRLGYGDVYHFSRHFKQAVGVPPATFRRSRQRG